MPDVDLGDETPLTGDLSQYGHVSYLKVNSTSKEPIWDYLIRKYHYLGYGKVIGGRVKYLCFLGNRLVAAIGYCAGSYKLGPRDKYVGWDEETKGKYLPHLLNNNRFLILPWIKIKNLASHILSSSLKKARQDWKEQYGKEPYFVETFVAREKYSGTCYIAANWTYLGQTKGFAKIKNTFVYHGNEKDIYVYIMNRRFKKIFKPNLLRLSPDREELFEFVTTVPTRYDSLLKILGVEKIDDDFFQRALTDHLLVYYQFIKRIELGRYFIVYIKALMSDLKRKSMVPMAIAFLNKHDVRKFSNFLTRGILDEKKMLEEYQKELFELVGHSEGMLTVDACDFKKKGNCSVGVMRQRSGPNGKIYNCQSGILLGYAGPNGRGLFDYELFMPAVWFEEQYSQLRQEAYVPKDLEYKPKSRIFSDMIYRAINSPTFKGKYIGLNDVFGREREYLDLLPKDLIYFASVSGSHRVFLGSPQSVNELFKNSLTPINSMSVKSLVEEDTQPWCDLSDTSAGTLIPKDKCIQVVEELYGRPGQGLWLYVRRQEDGSMNYWLSNEPLSSSPLKMRYLYSLQRLSEDCFKDSIVNFGLNSCEARRWHALRRHVLFIFLTDLFITKLRRALDLQEGKDNPSEAFKLLEGSFAPSIPKGFSFNPITNLSPPAPRIESEALEEGVGLRSEL
ncbi:MAG: DUF4338 domain-containing protein [Deltaproteobacteria bacterium]|jgi:SRSO17 transposase|nr:DUF4338 domain-containing protein [Deltaproteobacteria bacterium]